MYRRIRRAIGTWLGLAALLCQVCLPFGLARLADEGGLGLSAHNEHYHDPGLANALGRDWTSRHSHAGDTPSSRVRLDLAYLTPFTVMDPPALPEVRSHGLAFVANWMAPAPSAADAFSRPPPRAPPLPA
jgi:hypothetical protein